MARYPHKKNGISRRTFLRTLQSAPVLFLPAPLRGWPLEHSLAERAGLALPFADVRLSPHYPTKSPLDDLLLQAVPGSDEYVTEKYAFEIAQILGEWSRALRESPPASLSTISKFLDPSIQASRLAPM